MADCRVINCSYIADNLAAQEVATVLLAITSWVALQPSRRGRYSVPDQVAFIVVTLCSACRELIIKLKFFSPSDEVTCFRRQIQIFYVLVNDSLDDIAARCWTT